MSLSHLLLWYYVSIVPKVKQCCGVCSSVHPTGLSSRCQISRLVQYFVAAVNRPKIIWLPITPNFKTFKSPEQTPGPGQTNGQTHTQGKNLYILATRAVNIHPTVLLHYLVKHDTIPTEIGQYHDFYGPPYSYRIYMSVF